MSEPSHHQDAAAGGGFTVFIRLPFPRGDFVDPPPVSQSTAVGLWIRIDICRSHGMLPRIKHYGISFHDHQRVMMLIVRITLQVKMIAQSLITPLYFL